jgi:hypothetical protein
MGTPDITPTPDPYLGAPLRLSQNDPVCQSALLALTRSGNCSIIPRGKAGASTLPSPESGIARISTASIRNAIRRAHVADKRADLAGPGIGDYEELEKILPQDYRSLLTPKETQRSIFAVKDYIEENLCQELNLMMVTVPLIVDVESGVQD